MHLLAQRMALSPQRMMHLWALSPLDKQRKLQVMVFRMHAATQSLRSLSKSACEGTGSIINRRTAINPMVFIGGAINLFVYMYVVDDQENSSE
jgi:hypothetical protein